MWLVAENVPGRWQHWTIWHNKFAAILRLWPTRCWCLSVSVCLIRCNLQAAALILLAPATTTTTVVVVDAVVSLAVPLLWPTSLCKPTDHTHFCVRRLPQASRWLSSSSSLSSVSAPQWQLSLRSVRVASTQIKLCE